MTQRAVASRAIALAMAIMMLQPAWLWAVTQGPELPDPGRVGMTREEQVQLGHQAVGEVYKQLPVLPDSNAMSQYVKDLGRRLERVIPEQYSWPYEFHVIPQKDINAFALPGGPIFVNVGTITAADNEAELAGVIAHEMAHVYMQHSAKQAPKQQWAGLLSALGGLFGGSMLGSLAQLGIQFGAGTLLMHYSREDEAQADAVGAIIMYRANYDPQQMAQFFQKLEQQGGGGGPQFLSDHPNPGNRVAAVQREITDWPPKNFLRSSQSFQDAKRQASSVRAYSAEEIANGAKQGIWARENARGGAVPPAGTPSAQDQGGGADLSNVSYSQVRPSRRLTSLQQGQFSIAYPDNWQVFGGQQGGNGGIVIAPQAGVGSGAIGYGVVINAAQDQNATTLDDATQDLIRALQQQNPGLRQAGDMESITVRGMQARSVDLTGRSPVMRNGQSVSEHDWLVAMPSSQGGLLFLVFIAPSPDFNRLSPTFERMLGSLDLR